MTFNDWIQPFGSVFLYHSNHQSCNVTELQAAQVLSGSEGDPVNNLLGDFLRLGALFIGPLGG